MITCSVIIRTLNEEEHLARLLIGLEQQYHPPREIIVVDSGSEDATLAIAEAFGVRILSIPQLDFSFGRALNLGFNAMTSEVGVAMSAHVYPVKRTHLTELLRPFEDPSVGIAFGRQVGDERSHFSEKRLMLKWFPPDGSGTQTIPFSNNANAATRAEAWNQLQFDEDLTGLEDVEFCQRAMMRGWKVYYVAEAPVVHVHQENWNKIRNRYRRETRTLVHLDPNQNLSLPHAFGLSAINIWLDSVSAFREKSVSRDLTSILKFRTAQFLGVWEGGHLDKELSGEMKRRMFFPPSSRFKNSVSTDSDTIEYAEVARHATMD